MKKLLVIFVVIFELINYVEKGLALTVADITILGVTILILDIVEGLSFKREGIEEMIYGIWIIFIIIFLKFRIFEDILNRLGLILNTLNIVIFKIVIKLIIK